MIPVIGMFLELTYLFFSWIDISEWFLGQPEGRQRIVQEWYNAFTTCGFAIIVGHGVPHATIDTVYDLSQQYFNQPIDEKLKNCLNLGMCRYLMILF
jgi:isopenicillin N synthase-like dioxygenase